MPNLSVQTVIFLVCVGLFTLAAAGWDLRTRRIPNLLTLPAFVLGLGYQIVFYGWSVTSADGVAMFGLKSALLAFGVGFGSLLVLWIIGSSGGGDVKLMGALSVWLGLPMTLLVLVVSTLFVLVGTVVMIVYNAFTRGVSATRKQLAKKAQPVHGTVRGQHDPVKVATNRRLMAYAVPVALATWVVVLWNLPTF